MSERVHIFEHEPGNWWAECLVCGVWVAANCPTERAAEERFGRHMQNDPHPVP